MENASGEAPTKIWMVQILPRGEKMTNLVLGPRVSVAHESASWVLAKAGHTKSSPLLLRTLAIVHLPVSTEIESTKLKPTINQKRTTPE